MIPEAAKLAMQGTVPSVLATCGADGVPNITYVSQIWYVDDEHVASSSQFSKKSAQNLKENPLATIHAFDPRSGDPWRIDVKLVRTETEGATFDEMAAQLDAIAARTDLKDVFRLRAVNVFQVLHIERIPLVLGDDVTWPSA